MDFLTAFKKIIKTLPKLVERAEEAMKDGKITAEERKELVMWWVSLICEELDIKLGLFARWIISILVDRIAEKLPSKDIVLPLVYKKF